MEEQWLLLILIAYLLVGCAGQHKNKNKKLEEVIPVTMANLRGHQELYNDGFWIVTSTKNAIEYTKRNAGIKTARRFDRLGENVGNVAGDLATNVPRAVSQSFARGKMVVSTGHDISMKTFYGAGDLIFAQARKSGEWIGNAGSEIRDGYGNYAEHTRGTRAKFGMVPSDFGNEVVAAHQAAWTLTKNVNGSVFSAPEDSWGHGLELASDHHAAGLASSKKQSNSLTALFPLLGGQMKATYFGLLAPGVKSLARGTVKAATTLVALPAASIASTSWYGLKHLGRSIYYGASLAGSAISPPVKSVVYAGGAAISFSAIPVTAVVGPAAAGINEVLFLATGVVAGVGESLIRSGFETGKFVGLSGYHLGENLLGTSYDQISSAAVLGYNLAVTAPVHSVMGVADLVVFSFWDGPRLAVAAVQGEI